MKNIDALSLLVGAVIGAVTLWLFDYLWLDSLGTSRSIVAGGLLGAFVQFGERVSKVS
jgi:hypothetical protein